MIIQLITMFSLVKPKLNLLALQLGTTINSVPQFCFFFCFVFLPRTIVDRKVAVSTVLMVVNKESLVSFKEKLYDSSHNRAVQIISVCFIPFTG